ncbi:MAG: GNAT family N-acetyltransferase [Calothrix sp. SM1_5_4]|nr:GNAT family N-acetyltransferase [Calothrix sp. SM1_5_4]
MTVTVTVTVTVTIEPFRGTEEEERAIKEIFFLSSARQSFVNDNDREQFYQRWTRYYFASWPGEIRLARTFAADGPRLAGYLMFCPDSAGALSYFESRIPSYGVFADLFAGFPAHLHMNCHPSARGQGIGGRLIMDARKRAPAGVHIVTSPDSRNVGFYRRNGFSFEVKRSWNAYELLFMGARARSARE